MNQRSKRVFITIKRISLFLLLSWVLMAKTVKADSTIIASSIEETGISISVETSGEYYIFTTPDRVCYYVPTSSALLMKAPDGMKISINGTDYEDSIRFEATNENLCSELYMKSYTNSGEGNVIETVTKYRVTCRYSFIMDENPPEANYTIDGIFTAWGESYANSTSIIISVNAEDDLSGLGGAILHVGEAIYEISSPNTVNGYQFCPIITDNSLPIWIEVSDRVGNTAIIEPEIGSVCIDSDVPDITISRENDDGYKRNEVIYTKSGETLTIQMSKNTEAGSPLRYFKVEVNGHIVAETDYVALNRMCYQDTVSLPVFSDEDKDGLYSVNITVTDCAGNESQKSIDLYKDTEAPEILIYDLSGTNAERGDDIYYGKVKLISDENDRFACFASEKVHVYIKVKDCDGASGESYASYRLRENDKTILQKTVDFNESGEASFSIDADFKGELYITVYDHVGNASDEYINNGMLIVMSDRRFEDEAHIQINIPESEYTDQEECQLYNMFPEVGIDVFDTYAGIRDVKWQLYQGETVVESGRMKIGYDGSLIGEGEWTIESKEKNLIKEIIHNMPIGIEGNGFRLNVDMTNQIGFRESDEIRFSVDKTAPIITMEMITKTDHGIFYNTDCEVRVCIEDQNFDPDQIEIDGVEESIWTGEWVDEGNGRYVRNMILRNDEQYSLCVTATDCAGNQSEMFQMEPFVIDRIAPVATIAFEGDDASNGYYYNTPENVVISVSERNFDEKLFSIIVTENQTDSRIEGEWSCENGSYIMRIPFTRDGCYSLAVQGEDEAGNSAEEIKIPLFIIDTTFPEIEVQGIENHSAYNGDINFSIRTTDNNYDKESVKIELCGGRRGELDVMYSVIDEPDGQMFLFDNPEKNRDNDDLYTLLIKVTDLAGNEIEKSLQYSINRYGSVYTLGENALEVNGTFTSVTPHISIRETNVDRIKNDTVEIVLSRDGIPQSLRENRDYTVNEINGADEWKQYEYLLNDDVFFLDGVYTVALYTIDEAGNRNGTILKGNGEELKFGVDRTIPVIQAMNIRSHGIYGAGEINAAVTVKDNLELSGVTIYLNDLPISYENDGDIYKFSILERDVPQQIRIVAYDAAGNECVKEISDVLVSTVCQARWKQRIPIIIVLTVGTVFCVLLVVVKKKKVYFNDKC